MQIFFPQNGFTDTGKSLGHAPNPANGSISSPISRLRLATYLPPMAMCRSRESSRLGLGKSMSLSRLSLRAFAVTLAIGAVSAGAQIDTNSIAPHRYLVAYRTASI